jgi:two-component system KDP operon response regulator KdpE
VSPPEDTSPETRVILVIDDEPAFQRLLRIELTTTGYEVITAENGAEALHSLDQHSPDAIVLDLRMPDMPGLDVLAEIKRRTGVPVVILTSQDGEDVRAEALALGADDVLTKRMSLETVSSTLTLLLSRGAEALRDDVIHVGKVEVDLRHQEARLDGNTIRLSRTEWRLLQHLAEHRGRPRLSQELLTAVWGPEYRDDLEYLRLWMRRLATKLGDDENGPKAIRDYMRIGYALNVSES